MPFPVDRRLIERAERELGRALPDAFVRRLLHENGGEVKAAGDVWQLHPVFDDTDRKRIARTCNHILRETKGAREWAGFPADAIAIGANGSGDRLVLLPTGDRYEDKVYWWDHETRQVHEAAPSFAKLWIER